MVVYIIINTIIIIAESKYDDKAFIFTLKNPHGVEPTRYMKREGSRCAIRCNPRYGPIFGSDIYIRDNCNREDSCIINNNGTSGYEYHPLYKKSLFVYTARPDEINNFSVLDYEVFTY